MKSIFNLLRHKPAFRVPRHTNDKIQHVASRRHHKIGLRIDMLPLVIEEMLSPVRLQLIGKCSAWMVRVDGSSFPVRWNTSR